MKAWQLTVSRHSRPDNRTVGSDTTFRKKIHHLPALFKTRMKTFKLFHCDIISCSAMPSYLENMLIRQGIFHSIHHDSVGESLNSDNNEPTLCCNAKETWVKITFKNTIYPLVYCLHRVYLWEFEAKTIFQRQTFVKLQFSDCLEQVSSRKSSKWERKSCVLTGL